ncbi:MAG TPA: DUF4013 domain-containing protein [Chloroflexi bacterium]|nr:DUF4013 domain-containing protein [Chloroflexota bacterium]
MAGQIDVASLKEVFRFPFRGTDWPTRFLVGAALTFTGFWIPIVPLIFIAGYLLSIMRRVIEGEEPSLPAWEEWERLARDGLKATGIALAYLLPGILVLSAGTVAYISLSIAAPFAMGIGKVGEETFFLLLVLVLGLFFISLFVGMLLSLAGLVPLPVAMAEFAVSGEFASAFRLRRLWQAMRADGWGYFIAWVVLFGLGALAYIAMMLLYYTGVLCCLAPFVTALAGFYLWLVGAALFGQVYREAVGRGE